MSSSASSIEWLEKPSNLHETKLLSTGSRLVVCTSSNFAAHQLKRWFVARETCSRLFCFHFCYLLFFRPGHGANVPMQNHNQNGCNLRECSKIVHFIFDQNSLHRLLSHVMLLAANERARLLIAVWPLSHLCLAMLMFNELPLIDKFIGFSVSVGEGEHNNVVGCMCPLCLQFWQPAVNNPFTAIKAIYWLLFFMTPPMLQRWLVQS